MSTFVLSAIELTNIKKNTKQVIPGSFMTRFDDLQVVYRVVEGDLTILSEIFDGRKISYDGKCGEVCHEFVALCAYHKIRNLKVGVSSYKPTWIVNYPTGEYIAEEKGDSVVLHQRKGKIFIMVDGVYMNADVDLPKLKRLYIELGTGMYIPESYLFRVEKNGRFQYYPLRTAYGPLAVAQLTYRDTNEMFWRAMRESV